MADPKRAWRLAISSGLAVAMLFTGVGLAAWLIRTKPAAQRSDVGTLPPLVKVQALMPRDIEEVFTGYGSVRADREVLLSAEVGGPIVEIPEDVNHGSPVCEGQLLVCIDDRQYRQQLARAESLLADVEAQLKKLDVEKQNAERLAAIADQEVQVAHDEYKRLTDLFEKELASKKEWDFSRLAYQRALREWQVLANNVDLIEPQRAVLMASRSARLAEVELARLDVERCRIRAPFDGQVDQILVEEGDRVQIGGPILRMLDPRYVEVPVELPLSVRTRVELGATAVLTMDSLPGVAWTATVGRISPVADTRSRTFLAYIEVDNTTQKTPLMPGYFLTAKVTGPVLRQVLAVPRGAIADNQVFILNEGCAHARAVRIESLTGDLAVVSGEVSPGDQVILTNLDVLYDGAAVRWRPETSALAQKSAASAGGEGG